MMAPNALIEDMDPQDGGAYQSYSPEHYSDSEIDGGRGKGANGKPRTRLGYQRISIACCNTLLCLGLTCHLVYCRRRKIRCLPPIGDGDRCQNCARQQRECVVQPIAGSTRKGGRNQGNAISTDPMPYAEALLMTRQNHSLAHRRGSKPERYDQAYFGNPSIGVPSYGPASFGVMPMSTPAQFVNNPFMSPTHHGVEQAYGSDGSRRPAFKSMQSAPPGALYTLHTPFDRSSTAHEGYGAQWPQSAGHPHYSAIPQDNFHQSGQDMTSDTGNAFWKLSVTSPTATDPSLPPPRTQSQWTPNQNSNYTHERPGGGSVTLPAPHHVYPDGQTFVSQPQFYAPLSAPTVVQPAAFQNSPQASSASSQPHDDPSEGGSQWSRSTAATQIRAAGN